MKMSTNTELLGCCKRRNYWNIKS